MKKSFDLTGTHISQLLARGVSHLHYQAILSQGEFHVQGFMQIRYSDGSSLHWSIISFVLNIGQAMVQLYFCMNIVQIFLRVIHNNDNNTNNILLAPGHVANV
jgi:hypothetical protein